MRVDYTPATPVTASPETDLTPEDLADGWFPLARRWLADAVSAGAPEPNAIVLGTVDEHGHPATRTVLCKGIDVDGVTFFTNYGSDKARHLDAVPYASATFVWLPLHRQIGIRGQVTRIPAEETETYWRTRPRGSQLGAWASHQSQPVASRADLDHALVEAGERFGVDDDIPRPPFWGGFRISPEFVEFWQGRPNRMHNRVRSRLVDGRWYTQRLQP
ncbi:pyridoxamine 5'-phosphate oxidase [Rhodococcus sp. HNM0563]|uniref:pyridoxamine 5'-phosphate oxidase n=1 Tax=unclassified Rhodococcus (in: high G+C Gram-positive bacteria) TaxID=192944 RepID=UPI00146A8466|nr:MULTISPECIES: pyridoxamine 5'-phosphate oxidase [unclassified Rhodococcus (in: high G+C Gram-positive bacteria)]MCK0089476.1 pyridoxamine 5'-phosphate oxidase [Rhodococcus sp. F64268]NLU63004.1 pyridoxamine 5'-phosphate oxidase [Rhodococcus sp. HNM0563]